MKKIILFLFMAGVIYGQGYSVKSTANSTTSVLDTNGVYTGTGEFVGGYTSIGITVVSDKASATNGLVVQFGDKNRDNTFTWSKTYKYSYTAADTNYTKYLPIAAPYLKVTYTNGTDSQTVFRLITMSYYNHTLGVDTEGKLLINNDSVKARIISLIPYIDGVEAGLDSVKGRVVNQAVYFNSIITKHDTLKANVLLLLDELNKQSTAIGQDTLKANLLLLLTEIAKQSTATNQTTQIARADTINAIANRLLTELSKKPDDNNVTVLNDSIKVWSIDDSTYIKNFPATQAVSVDSVPNVSNLLTELTKKPNDNVISGTVTIGNDSVKVWSIDDSVYVKNFPATQAVSQSGNWSIAIGDTESIAIKGNILIGNYPATQTVDGTVNAAQSGNWSVAIGDTESVAIKGNINVNSHNVTNAGTFAVQAAQSGTWTFENYGDTAYYGIKDTVESLGDTASVLIFGNSDSTSLTYQFNHYILGEVVATDTAEYSYSAGFTNSFILLPGIVNSLPKLNISKANNVYIRRYNTTGETGIVTYSLRIWGK